MKYLFLIGLFLIPFLLSGQNGDCAVHLGKDVTVCEGAAFRLNPTGPVAGRYIWSGDAGLNCNDCPSPLLTLTTAGTYVYTVQYLAFGCDARDTLKVTVLSGQQPRYNIAKDQDVCQGDAVTLGGPPVQGTNYIWYSNPVTFTVGGAQPVVNPTQDIVWYLSATASTCAVPAIDSVVLRVFQSPSLHVLSDTAICAGASVTLGRTTAQAGVIYQWTADKGTIANPALPNPVVAPVETTTYRLSASNEGCKTTATVRVNVVPLEIAFNVPDTVGICAGQSLRIRSTVTPSGDIPAWQPGVQLEDGGRTAVVRPATDITYTARVQVSGCAKSKSVHVRVSTLPPLWLRVTDTTICAGQPVTSGSPVFDPLSFPHLTFQWSPSQGLQSGANANNVQAAPVVSTAYRRIADNRGCRDTSFLRITVRNNGARISPSDTTVCAGNSVTLRFNADYPVQNLMWSPDTAHLSCTLCTTPVATPASTTVYTLTGYDTELKCVFKATAVVRVSSPQTVEFPSDTKLCIGDTLLLNRINDPTTTYFWSSSDPSLGTFTTAQPRVVPQRATTFFVKITNQCGSDQKSISIDVFDGNLRISRDTTVCKGRGVLLNALGDFPGTYTWSDGQTGQAVLVQSNKTTTYQVVYNYGDGCRLKANTTVFIADEGVDVTFPSDTRLCAGESLLLNSQATLNATYEWTSSPPGFMSLDPTPEVQPTQNTTYILSTRFGNCVQTYTLPVEVAKADLQVTKDTVICKGEVLALRAVGTATGRVQYRWLLGSDTLSREPVWTSQAGQAGTYRLIYTFGDDCRLVRDVQVQIKAGLDSVNIVAEPDTTKIFAGDTLVLRAVINPTQSLAGFRFTWTENGATRVGSEETLMVTRTVTDDNPALFNYKLEVRSAGGCLKTDVFSLTVCPDLIVIPNAFTPDGDQVNDSFGLHVLGGRARVQVFSVYNRWGNLIYQSTQPNARWDGRINGVEAPSDTYIYIIEYRKGSGKLIIDKGEVLLLR